MNPQIGAALIAVGGAVISVGGIVVGVLIAAGRTRKQKRGELAAAAMSDYVKAAAQSVTVRRLHDYAASLSDDDAREHVMKEALRHRPAGASSRRARQDHAPCFRGLGCSGRPCQLGQERGRRRPEQQRALLKAVNGIRRQIDTKADNVHEPIGLSLVFGQPDNAKAAGQTDDPAVIVEPT